MKVANPVTTTLTINKNDTLMANKIFKSQHQLYSTGNILLIHDNRTHVIQ